MEGLVTLQFAVTHAIAVADLALGIVLGLLAVAGYLVVLRQQNHDGAGPNGEPEEDAGAGDS